jgi:hypothetical protein
MMRDVTSAPVPVGAPSPRPMLARSISTAVLLTAQLILSFLLCVAFGLRLSLLTRVSAGVPVEPSAFGVTDALIVFGSRLSLPLSMATAVAFLMWLYRANQNARALGSDTLEFTPGEAVGSFFIPFLNLFRPYQAVRELWRASDPGGAASGDEQTIRGGWIVGVWWLLFLVRNLPAWWLLAAQRAGGSPLETLTRTGYAALALYLLTIPAAAVAVALVFLIDRRQDALLSTVRGRPIRSGRGDGSPAATSALEHASHPGHAS